MKRVMIAANSVPIAKSANRARRHTSRNLLARVRDQAASF